MSLTLTQGRTATLGVRRRTLSARVELGATSLLFVVVALALVVSLIYLAHANRVATRGYVIKRLEAEKSAIVTTNEIWRQQVSEAKSLATLKASAPVQDMVPVRDVTYINPELSVAQR